MAKLSTNPAEAEPGFLKIVEKMQTTDAIVWTFGAWLLYVPVHMQYLLDKLFAQGYNFRNKVGAAGMTPDLPDGIELLGHANCLTSLVGGG